MRPTTGCTRTKCSWPRHSLWAAWKEEDEQTDGRRHLPTSRPWFYPVVEQHDVTYHRVKPLTWHRRQRQCQTKEKTWEHKYKDEYTRGEAGRGGVDWWKKHKSPETTFNVKACNQWQFDFITNAEGQKRQTILSRDVQNRHGETDGSSPCDATIVQPLLSSHNDVKSAPEVVRLYIHDLHDRTELKIRCILLFAEIRSNVMICVVNSDMHHCCRESELTFFMALSFSI